MNAIRPITFDQFGSKRWRGAPDYRFAATASIAPVAAAELAKAVHVYPLAFVEIEGSWSLVAVLGLKPGQNLFVAPSGKWATSYIPAAFRSHPFRLARTEAGEYALCVDEASGLVVDGTEGAPFFDDSGRVTEGVSKVFDFLVQTARSREATNAACATLAQHGVIEPWPVKIQDGDQERQVGGLNRINETALNGLSDDAFLALRRAGALPIAYAQLLSMGNLATLGRLADLHRKAQAQIAAQAAATQNLDLDQVFSNNSTVDWSKLTGGQ